MRNKQQNRISRILVLAAFLLVSFNLQAVDPVREELRPEPVKNFTAGNFALGDSTISKGTVNLQAGTDLNIYQGADEQYAQNADLDFALLLKGDLVLKQTTVQPELAVKEKDSLQTKVSIKRTKSAVSQKLVQSNQKDLIQAVVTARADGLQEGEAQELYFTANSRSIHTSTYFTNTSSLNRFEIMRC